MLPILLALLLFLTALLLRSSVVGRRTLSTRVTTPVVVFTVVGSLTVGGLLLVEPGPPSVAVSASPPKSLPSQVRGPLAPGEKISAFQVGGWLNGEPKPHDASSVKLTVLDFWADWCPYCRNTASGLVEVYSKFRLRGVQFVSLTNMNREATQHFVNGFEVSWPAAYDVPDESLREFGVYNQSMNIPGYSLSPTLYLLDGSGKVVWCDGHARMKHTPPTEVTRELERQLEMALGH